MAWASTSDVKGDVRCPSFPGNSTEHCTAASHLESESYLNQHCASWPGADERLNWQ